MAYQRGILLINFGANVDVRLIWNPWKHSSEIKTKIQATTWFNIDLVYTASTGDRSVLRDWETETETSLFNTTWHYTDAWYQTYMTVLMYYSVLTWYKILACMLGDFCEDHFWSLTQRPHWRDKKDSATNEKCWHHFRILIADKWSVVWNECKNREFLFTGWKSLWSLATWLVISDRYIGEVILQLSIEAMASHSNTE